MSTLRWKEQKLSQVEQRSARESIGCTFMPDRIACSSGSSSKLPWSLSFSNWLYIAMLDLPWSQYTLISVGATLAEQCIAKHARHDPSKSEHLLDSALHSTLNKASTNTYWIVQCDLDLTMLHTLLSGASHTILSGASRLEAYTTSSCRSKNACSCSCVLLSAGSDSVMLYNAGNVCVCRLVFSLACSRHLNKRQMAIYMEAEQQLE